MAIWLVVGLILLLFLIVGVAISLAVFYAMLGPMGIAMLNRELRKKDKKREHDERKESY